MHLRPLRLRQAIDFVLNHNRDHVRTRVMRILNIYDFIHWGFLSVVCSSSSIF